MTIKEWLTPDFMALNIILVSLMINWTLYAIVSNFLEDFHMPDRVQAANYFGAVLMTAIFFVLVAVLPPVHYLYPNPYNWLLIGNGPVLAAVLGGAAGGVVLGWLFGGNKKLKIGAGVAAVACEGLIAAFTLLWILSQE